MLKSAVNWQLFSFRGAISRQRTHWCFALECIVSIAPRIAKPLQIAKFVADFGMWNAFMNVNANTGIYVTVWGRRATRNEALGETTILYCHGAIIWARECATGITKLNICSRALL